VIAADRADWDRQIFQTDLWLYRDDANGAGSLTQLTQSGHESVPRWSPDGRWIAFLSERRAPAGKGRDPGEDRKDTDADKPVAQIYLISPHGGEAFPITFTDEEVHAFSWSPDSRPLFCHPLPLEQDQKDSYRKVWKDTVQYRAAERATKSTPSIWQAHWSSMPQAVRKKHPRRKGMRTRPPAAGLSLVHRGASSNSKPRPMAIAWPSLPAQYPTPGATGRVRNLFRGPREWVARNRAAPAHAQPSV